MTPWWIISLLDDDGELKQSDVHELIDHQLRKWSSDAGMAIGDDGLFWWRIDRFEEENESTINQFLAGFGNFLKNPLKIQAGEIRPRVSGDIDATRLNIAILGDIRSSRCRVFFHTIAQYITEERNHLFEGIADVGVTGLLFIPQNLHRTEHALESVSFLSEADSLMQRPEVAKRPFDRLIVVQDNNVSNENPSGYTDLIGDQAAESLAAILFHLAATNEDIFASGADPDSPSYYSCGAVSVFNDHQTIISRQVDECAQQLISDLKDQTGEPFTDAGQASAAVRPIRKQFEIRRLFETLIEDRPEFSFEMKVWEGAKDGQGKAVSPWRFWSVELLLSYFRIFLRYLPLRLSEYARLFLTDSLRKFERHLEARRELVLKGSSNRMGLEAAVHEAICKILSGKFGGARSLPQVKNAINEAKEFFNSVARSDTELNQIDTFANLEVFLVPGYLSEFYRVAPDLSTPNKEEELYKALTEEIQRHPIPLALFVRALFASVVMWFLAGAFFEWYFPPTQSETLKLGLNSAAAALPLAIAVFWYKIAVLDRLRLAVRKYVAAALKLAQVRAKSAVIDAVREIGSEGIQICEKLEKAVEELGGSLEYKAEDAFDYKKTVFSIPLSRNIAIPTRNTETPIMPDGLPPITFRTSAGEKGFSELTHNDRNELLRGFLDRTYRNGETVAKLICDRIPAEGDNAGEIDIILFAAKEAAKASHTGGGVQSFTVLLGTNNEQYRRSVSSALMSLSAPPVVIHSGVGNINSIRFQTLTHSEHEQLAQLLFLTGVRGFGSANSTVFSVMSVRKIDSLADIAALHALRDNAGIVEHVDSDVSVQRKLTFYYLNSDADAPAPLNNIVSGDSIEISEEIRMEINELQVGPNDGGHDGESDF